MLFLDQIINGNKTELNTSNDLSYIGCCPTTFIKFNLRVPCHDQLILMTRSKIWSS